MIHPTAVIGEPPEQRGFQGPPHAPLIDNSARVEAYATVDSGAKRHTRVDAGAWLFKHSHVGHDAWIGENVEISTGAVIGGFAVICDGARVGLNATVLPYRTIGPRAVIGAGAVVTKDVPADETWAGNPARKLEDHERDSRPHTQRGGAVVHA